LKNFASYSAMALAFAATTPAYAQADDEPVLEEIVVTAQKREQSLQDVPISVTALTGESLREAGAISMNDVSRLTPSLTTLQNDTPLNQSYRIRGIGSDPNIPTFEPDVGLFIDGVYLPRSGLGIEDLVDVERVEVLAGPQSTLYGKNVTAGVINVVTKSPTNYFEGHVAASISQLQGAKNAAVIRTEGSIAGPVSDSVRARLTGVYYNQGATYKNLVENAHDANDQERYAIRGVVEFDLSADVRLSLSGARTEIFNTRQQDPDMFYYGNLPFVLDSQLGPLFGVTPCPDNDPKNRVICNDSPYEFSSNTNIATATLTAAMGPNTLTSITAWSNYSAQRVTDNIDHMRIPLLRFDDAQAGETLTQEIRIVSPGGGKLDWLAGVYYLHSTFERGDHGRHPIFVLGAAAPFIPLAPGIPFGQPGDSGFVDSRAKSDYFAVFGQATYRLSEQFVLTGGLRLQTETKEASIDNSVSTSPAHGGINAISALLTPVRVNSKFNHETDDITWSMSGEFHPNEDTMLYATYARGGKSGGFNIGFGSTRPADRPFGDEKVDNYEIGAKWTSADRRARLGISAFHTVYTDYQNASFVSLQFLVNNAEKVTTEGIEANGVFAIAEGLTVNAAATYTDAKYSKYTEGSCFTGQTPTNAGGTCDLSGKRMPLIPEWRTSAAIAYEHGTDFGDIYGRVDWSWQSSLETNTNLDPRHTQNSYSLVNLRLGVRTDSNWDVSLWMHNVADETHVMQTAVHNIFGNDPAYQTFLGEPREFGITVRKNF